MVLHGTPVTPRTRRRRCARIVVSAVVFAFSQLPAFAADAVEKADSGNSDISTALIALIGVILSALISVVLAWYTAKRTATSEQVKRQSELALRISDLVSNKDGDVRLAALRRFAIAIIKVEEPVGHPEVGKVYFIPMNARVTVGRSDDNDIVLKDKNNYLSRWHCGFIADQHNVWIDDYCSINGTSVGGVLVAGSPQLANGDVIEIGPYKLQYRTIKENSILSQ